jgi:hypothetical protein
MSKNKSILTKFSMAWLVMWAISYITVAFVSPQIQPATPFWVFLLIGVTMLSAIMLSLFAKKRIAKLCIAFVLSIFGIGEVCCGVASWVGKILWNVPFANIELFQVSMAFLDVISAAFLFYYVMELMSDSS